MTTTLDDVQQLANQLSPLDQFRLIEYLSRQIAPALIVPVIKAAEATTGDAWAKLARLREELAQLPAGRLASEQLVEDRAERQALIEGARRVHS
jgi:hypothetical protein